MSSTALWSSSINDYLQLKDFAGELAVDHKTTGTWGGDYEYYTNKLGIHPCPSFSIVALEDGKTSCKIANRIVDIASWRTMLLACTSIGNTISEIAIHNCRLSPLHVTDLLLALEKLGRLDVLKLDYIDLAAQPPLVQSQSLSTIKNTQPQSRGTQRKSSISKSDADNLKRKLSAVNYNTESSLVFSVSLS